MPVTKSTSAAPYAKGPGRWKQFLEKLREGRVREAEPPVASPQAIMMSPAPKFSILSMPSRESWHSQIPEEGLGC